MKKTKSDARSLKPFAKGRGVSFQAFMQQTVDWLSQMGKNGTAATYRTALSSFMRFCDHREVPMEAISSDLMLHYESWLRNQGICKNCSSAYMRSLRSVYNRAVDSGLIPQKHPFLHVYTGVDKTAKRAVSLETIRSLKNLDLADRPGLAFARDLFMFSFYTRGMAFVDMAFLKHSDIRDGYLCYVRRKTRQQLCIRWEECMQTTVDQLFEHAAHHACKERNISFLLPIIRKSGNQWQQYKSCQRLVNHHLKTISTMIDATADIPLTMYVARHSWASIARSKDIPLSVISEALGHNNEQTTQIYLGSLETSRIDEANRKIIGFL